MTRDTFRAKGGPLRMEQHAEALADAFRDNHTLLSIIPDRFNPPDPTQYAADLLEWYNIAEESIGADDLNALFRFGTDGQQFHAFDCPLCHARTFHGQPRDWGQFQCVNQNECFRVCDYCMIHDPRAAEIENED